MNGDGENCMLVVEKGSEVVKITWWRSKASGIIMLKFLWLWGYHGGTKERIG